MKRLIHLLLSLIPISCFSQTGLPFDVLHYRFNVELNDRNDSIHGLAEIKLVLLEPAEFITLDLVKRKPNGKGMHAWAPSGSSMVKGVSTANEKLVIALSQKQNAGDTISLQISYSGIPADGLIISKNKYGNRTFFSDNWPNRAHHWLPCVDHPADKASVEFLVTAPNHYQVVSNGIQVEETDLAGNKKLTHWKEDVPLPTKIMVIGVAEFAVQYAGDAAGIPVYSWVYPENRKEGFYDYEQAKDILPFFVSYIGPYPYKKLANIQSKTMFGGMENASAIFYSEGSVSGKREIEGLLAHEIAHQWFGNMASEKNFSHLWLSEGFATYFTDLYMENKYGAEKMKEMLREQRNQVIRFSKSSKNAVLDTNQAYMDLLNANSYQKGGWILHMLRQEVGDAAFQKIISNYYQRYAGKNADSDDFRKVAEELSGKNLEQFFRQWLTVPGQPGLDIQWNFDLRNSKLNIKVLQKQPTAFSFPLELQLKFQDGVTTTFNWFIDAREKLISTELKEKPLSISIDPDVKLLFEGKIIEVKDPS